MVSIRSSHRLSSLAAYSLSVFLIYLAVFCRSSTYSRELSIQPRVRACGRGGIAPSRSILVQRMSTSAVQEAKHEVETTKRNVIQGLMLGGMALKSSVFVPDAQAKKRIPLTDYSVTEAFEWREDKHTGIRYYDVKEGKGSPIKSGQKLTLHYDCSYKSIIAVSTRQAVLLSQNRYLEKPYDLTYGKIPEILKEPLEYTDAQGVGVRIDPDPIYPRDLFVTKIYKDSAAEDSDLKIFDEILLIDGQSVEGLSKQDVNKGKATILIERNSGRERIQKEISIEKKPYRKLVKKRIKSDRPQKTGGLYSGEDLAPPPDMLFVPEALAGMKKGGLRRIEVPADLGYGPEGKNEIPGDETFFVEVELLDVR